MSSNKRQKLREQAEEYLRQPRDVFYLILANLTPEDIAAMCRVSRKFDKLCSKDGFWGQILNAARIPHSSDATNEQNRRMFIAYKAYESRQTIQLENLVDNTRIWIEFNNGGGKLILRTMAFPGGRPQFDAIQPIRELLDIHHYMSSPDYNIRDIDVIHIVYRLMNDLGYKLVVRPDDPNSTYLSCAICGEMPEHTCSTCDRQFCSVECSIKSKC